MPDRPSVRFLSVYWQVYQALSERVEDPLQARHGLALRDLIALGQLLVPGSDNPTALARALGLPKYVISRTLERLGARGVVSYQLDAGDSRLRHYCVTPAGEALLGAALVTVDEQVQPLLSPLGEGAAHLTGLLGALLKRPATPHVTLSNGPIQENP